MRTEVHVEALGGHARGSVEARKEELARQVAALRMKVASAIALFREAFREFAGQWMRDAAKKVVIAQNQRTLALGKPELARLKRRVEEHSRGLEGAIAAEFTDDRYADAPAASSGQVRPLTERRFDQGIRKILATLGPILESAGFVRDETWVDVEPAEGQRARYPRTIELPLDIGELIGKVADAITDMKVIDAKTEYLDRERDRDIAADLWDSC